MIVIELLIKDGTRSEALKPVFYNTKYKKTTDPQGWTPAKNLSNPKFILTIVELMLFSSLNQHIYF